MTAIASADITKLAQALRQSGADAQATTQRVLVESANFLLTEMEIRVPVDSGNLRKSLSARLEGDKVVVGPTAPYAPYVEFGTAPHEIRAKNKKALSFMVGGKKVTVKSVHHPGTKAQPFVRPAYEAWKQTIALQVGQRNVENIVKEAS